MKINTDEITSVIKQEVANYNTQLDVSQVGTVVEVGDGIARIYGLANAMAGEMLEFETKDGGTVSGQVMNLEEDIVGAVIFGDYLGVREGMTVKSTGQLLSTPAGEGLLGLVCEGRGVEGGGVFGRAPVHLRALPLRGDGPGALGLPLGVIGLGGVLGQGLVLRLHGAARERGGERRG